MSNGEDPEAFDERLDDAEESLEAAETEADLDDVEAMLDEVETDLEEVDFDVATGEDEEETAEGDEDPREELEDRLGDLRDRLEDQRGPYVEDVTAVLSAERETVASSEWTEEGIAAVAEAVRKFCDIASDAVEPSFTLEAEDADGLASTLSRSVESLEACDLDPDEDADAILTLLSAAEMLADDLDDAEVLGDLEIREQLRRLGFYDVLEPENMRDFPPEWNAVKLYEVRGEVEPLLTALEKLDSTFMEENILDALEHMAPAEAFEPVHNLAQRRNKQPVRILGRIGDERACSTLENFLGGGDVKLETECLRALGSIGSRDSTEPVAQRLAADNPVVRSEAARALGLIGDTRAIAPLADVLGSDDDASVRASAAWALNQIGTERALEAVSAHEDDRSSLVRAEVEKAARV